jgi:Uma2 family endonuclease
MHWQEVINHPSLKDLPFKIELNKYGKIEMSPASNHHGRLQGRIFSLLEKLGKLGELYLECSIQTSAGVKVADVAWCSKDFFQAHGEETPLQVAPEICVEVLSPSNSDAEMSEKIDLYLARGAKEVWICDDRGGMSFYAHAGRIGWSAIIGKFPSDIFNA